MKPLRLLTVILFTILITCGYTYAEIGAGYAPLFMDLDTNGDPCSGCKLYTYETGTTTPKTTWTDATKGTPNANPVVLDSRGHADVWVDTSSGYYRFKLTDSDDVEIYTVDRVGPVPSEFDVGHNTDGSHKMYRLLSEFDDLADAVTDIGGTETILGIAGANAVSDDVTVPSNIWLWFAGGGYLTPAATKTITIYSPDRILAGRGQRIFDVTNNTTDPVAFTLASDADAGRIYPGWFGAVADDTTNNDDEILATINVADDNECEVYWIEGEFLITTTKPDFHTVRHAGPGVIRTGAAGPIFAPNADRYNTSSSVRSELFVDDAGNDDNIGTSSSLAFLTIQKAFDTLKRYAKPMLAGNWTINIGAGTYTEGADYTYIPSKNTVIIDGEAPTDFGVPTTIIDGTGASKTRGLHFTRRAHVRVQDILIRDFDDDNEHAGMQVEDWTLAYLINIHTDNNQVGFFLRGNSRVYVEGGDIDCGDRVDGYAGIQAYGNVIFNTDYTGVRGGDTLGIEDCGQGIQAWEYSHGHADELTIDDCDTGVYLAKASRATLDNTVITNCTRGVRAQAGSIFYLSDPQATVFSHSSNPNDLDYELEAYSQPEVSPGDRTYSDLFLSSDTVEANHTGNTNETTLKTYTNYIPANSIVKAGQGIIIRVYGNNTGTAGSKTLRVKMAGTTVCTATLGTTADDWSVDCKVMATGANAQDIMLSYAIGATGVTFDHSEATITVDETVGDLDFEISGQLGNSGDTIQVEYVEFARRG